MVIEASLDHSHLLSPGQAGLIRSAPSGKSEVDGILDSILPLRSDVRIVWNWDW